VQRFRSARSHHSRHHPRERAYKQLHHSDVIEKRENGGDKNDGGQHLKRENKSERGSVYPQSPKNKFGAGKRKTQQLVYGIPELLKQDAAQPELQHKYPEGQLQAQSPQDCLKLDRVSRR